MELNDVNIEEKAEKAAESVMDKSTTSVKILDELGPYLTDVNLGRRKIGVSFLSNFLSALSKDFMTPEECQLFSHFYKDRLNDHHSLTPLIIKGLDAIFAMKNVSNEDLQILFRAFFAQVHTQSQIVTDRRAIFQIFQQLLHEKLDVIKPLGSEFVLAFVQAVDAEKDPLCMSLIFSLWPLVLTHFNLDPFEEDVFEAMSCYFPIDFSPPKGVEVIVSKEDLVLALRKCLSTSSIFAPLAIPLFMDKLDSELQDSKIDANLTLIECLKKYSSEQVKSHLNGLWDLLKKEILGIKMNVNEEVIQSCHGVIFQVTMTLASSLQSYENRQILEQNWLEMIWQDVGRHLKDIELKFMSLSIDILVDVISTSKPFPSAFMLEKSMPILLQLHQNLQGSTRHQVQVFFYIARLLKNASDPGKTRPKWYDNFLHICLGSLNSQDHDLANSAALTLTSGGHFLEQINAEQIFDAVLESDHHELIYSCMKRCNGSRPREADFSRLHELKKSKTLAVLYRDISVLERDLERVLQGLQHGFGFDVLMEVVKYHKTMKNETLKQIIEAVLKKEEEDAKKMELLALISPKLDKNFAGLIMKISSLKVLQSLLAFANVELINSLDEEFQRKIISSNEIELAQVKGSILNKVKNPQILLKDEPMDLNNLLWITKGLLFRMQTFPKVQNWITKILGHLKNGEKVDFETLIGPLEPFFICNESKAALTRQKIFLLTKNALVNNFKQNVHATLHLKSLICQLPFVPKFALANEISNVLPLLIKGLDADSEESLCYASLSCLKDLIEHDPNQFEAFISSLLPAWLEIAKNRGKSIKSRIKALECIKASAKIESKSIVPLKKDVIKNLTPTLDDHKRLVRQAATTARNCWCVC